MAKINIKFNGVTYAIDESRLADIVANFSEHLAELKKGPSPAPGLYQAGAVALYEEQGAEAVEGMMYRSWDYLIEEGYLTVDDNGCITNSNKNLTDGDLILPTDGTVTSIGNNAFENHNRFTGILIPRGIISIGEKAFFACVGLNTKITIPNSVKNIGAYAFSNTDITSIVIGTGITSISDFAFSNCGRLTSVILSNNITSIGKKSFYSCSKMTSIVIPEGVASIGDDAFSYCSNLTIYCKAATQPEGWSSSWNKSGRPVYWGYKGNGTTENGLEYVCTESGAFITKYSGTDSNVIIPEAINDIKVTAIGDSAFIYNENLISVVLPNSIAQLDRYAFGGCNALESITFNGTIEQWNAITKYTTSWNEWNAGTGEYTIHCTDGDIAKA